LIEINMPLASSGWLDRYNIIPEVDMVAGLAIEFVAELFSCLDSLSSRDCRKPGGCLLPRYPGMRAFVLWMPASEEPGR
jgi:hypothetical protein